MNDCLPYWWDLCDFDTLGFLTHLNDFWNVSLRLRLYDLDHFANVDRVPDYGDILSHKRGTTTVYGLV